MKNVINIEGVADNMESVIQDILYQIDNLSNWIVYLFFFLSAVLQITVPPYPGDTLLVFGGYMGSTQLDLGFMPIFISYWLGTVVTSYVLYELGKWKGEAILRSKFISKYFGKRHQDRAKTWVLKYGLITFFICKFIPGVNSLIIIFGGIFKYNKIWAYIGIGIASLVHNIIFFSTGRTIGSNWDNIKNFLRAYNRTVLIVLGIGLAVYLIYWFTRRFKKKAS